jgi:hypothetical protein
VSKEKKLEIKQLKNNEIGGEKERREFSCLEDIPLGYSQKY